MKKQNPIRTTITILIILFALSLILAGALNVLSGDETTAGNVAIISIKGMIITDEQGGLFQEGVAASSKITRLLQAAEEDAAIKAIVL